VGNKNSFPFWSNFRYLYAKYVQLIRFGIVGVINTGVDFAVFTLLNAAFGVEPLICQIVGYSAGIANSFVMNKLWTFESKKSNISTQFQLFKFVLINLVSLGLSLLGLKILNGYFEINIYIAKVIVTVLAQIVNYLGYKVWVFRQC